MKAKDIVGKTVARVDQQFWTRADGAHTPGWVIEQLVFTDGTVLVLSVVEGEASYGVEGLVVPAATVRRWGG